MDTCRPLVGQWMVLLLLLISSTLVAEASLRPSLRQSFTTYRQSLEHPQDSHELRVSRLTDSSINHTSTATAQHNAGRVTRQPREPLMLPDGWRTPPGLLAAIVGTIIVAIAYTAIYAWSLVYPSEELDIFKPGTPRVAENVDLEGWKAAVEKGELDTYSCFALSLGRHKVVKDVDGKQPLRFLPKLCVLFCLQVILGILFIIYEVHDIQFYPTQQGACFRLLGGMLYLYSCYVLYEGMFDECREWVFKFIDAKLEQGKPVPGWYLAPSILGEFFNTFVTAIMMLLLFLIFCKSTRPQDLLINCIAINFVVEIDNQLVSDRERDEAVENFDAAVRQLSEEPHPDTDTDIVASRHSTSRSLRSGSHYFIAFVRFLIPIGGAFLAFLFVFANNVGLCHRMQWIEPWPFCIGIQI